VLESVEVTADFKPLAEVVIGLVVVACLLIGNAEVEIEPVY